MTILYGKIYMSGKRLSMEERACLILNDIFSYKNLPRNRKLTKSNEKMVAFFFAP